MLNTKDMETMLLKKALTGPIKETGYECESGNSYIELRNVCFQVDKPYIFEELPKYDRVTSEWYDANYTPKIANQLENVIRRIVENPLTRQAVILMSDENGIVTDNICTMYMHIMLDKAENGNYDMDYIVHMRSSDAIEFGNDMEWHLKIASLIRYMLCERGVKVNEAVRFIWNADTFHLYKETVDKLFGK